MPSPRSEAMAILQTLTELHFPVWSTCSALSSTAISLPGCSLHHQVFPRFFTSTICFHNPNELRTPQIPFSTLSSADSAPLIKATPYSLSNFLLNNEFIPFFLQEGIHSDSQRWRLRLLVTLSEGFWGGNGNNILQKVLHSKGWLFPHKIHMDEFKHLSTLYFNCCHFYRSRYQINSHTVSQISPKRLLKPSCHTDQISLVWFFSVCWFRC